MRLVGRRGSCERPGEGRPNWTGVWGGGGFLERQPGGWDLMLELAWCPGRRGSWRVDWRRCKVEEMDAEMQAQRWRGKHRPFPAASSQALSPWFPGNSLGRVRVGFSCLTHTCELGKWPGQPGALKIMTWRHLGSVGLGQGRAALSLGVSPGKG